MLKVSNVTWFVNFGSVWWEKRDYFKKNDYSNNINDDYKISIKYDTNY